MKCPNYFQVLEIAMLMFCCIFFQYVCSQNTPTTATVTAPPNCSTNGTTYESDTCNVYYRCVQALWNFYVVNMTCPAGQAYNPTSLVCEDSSTCGVTTTTTTTTAATTTTVATNVTAPTSCSTNGAFYASSTCNVYYRCVLALWNYYVVEITCPSGQAYNSTSQVCEDSLTCV